MCLVLDWRRRAEDVLDAEGERWALRLARPGCLHGEFGVLVLLLLLLLLLALVGWFAESGVCGPSVWCKVRAWPS